MEVATPVRHNPLTAQDLQHYRQQGFLLLGRVLDDQQLGGLREEEARFRRAAAGEITVFRPQLCNYSEIVRQVCIGGAQVPLVRQLIGPNVCLWWNQMVTKLPDAAAGKSEFPWHQDNGYVMLDPPSNITIWVALDDVDERNGCVWILPGSHTGGLLPHAKKTEQTWHLAVKTEGEGVPAILKAGEAVAFSGLTLHRSKLNHTDRPRRAFFMEYADAAARFSRDLEQWTPVVESPDSWLVAGQLPWKDSA